MCCVIDQLCIFCRKKWKYEYNEILFFSVYMLHIHMNASLVLTVTDGRIENLAKIQFVLDV